MKTNYAIFDFCQTICMFETGDAFLDYVSSFESNKRIKRIESKQRLLKKTGIIFLFDVIGHFFHFSITKKIEISKIRGISRKKIESYALSFYNDVVKKNLILETIKRLQKAKQKGYKIAIVSASYVPLLKHFQREFEIDVLIANEFEYKDGLATGRLTRKDCIYRNKVKYFFENVSADEAEIQESYADSKQDIPILNVAHNMVVVSKCKHKKWAKPTKYMEVIWNEQV